METIMQPSQRFLLSYLTLTRSLYPSASLLLSCSLTCKLSLTHCLCPSLSAADRPSLALSCVHQCAVRILSRPKQCSFCNSA